MQMTSKVFILILFVSSLQIYSQTQGELNDEAYAEYQKQEHELDSVYNKILAVYNENSDDSIFVAKLIVAQKAWLVFRDAHIASIYPVEEHMYYGSVFPMCYYYSLADIIKKRTEELKIWLEGTIYGDACMGSVKYFKQGE